MKKKFWEALRTAFTQAALWAADHPDQVIAIVTAATAKKK